MKWYWLSFATPAGDHLGVCIVKGDVLEEAVQSSFEHECNPGGGVCGFGPFTLEEMGLSPAATERLLTGEDINQLGLRLRHTDERGNAA